MEYSADAPFLRNVADEPVLDRTSETDRQLSRQPKTSRAEVKWMGGDAETGPWVYWVEVPAGSVTKPHRHFAPRIEFVVEGAIEWFQGDDALELLKDEPEKAGIRYGPGSLSYMPPGTLYGYRILEDTRMLHVFFANPVGAGTQYHRDSDAE